LERKKRETSPTPPIFDGRAEARLIAIACSTPPEGRATRNFRVGGVLAQHQRHKDDYLCA
ncbi:MAG: hypothetical protein FWD31_16095, partial [Planctomycetaceae bacterium]|nr:hypothetical protein [Planctomycetaceae bacterium]